MAELNFKQITDKFNEEFTGEVRKLIFWYDANAEFQEEVADMELEHAKVLFLEKDNQFRIKYLLEREDTTTNYLIYAPFPKPNIRENHLADTIRYSKEFFADRTSILCRDLGIDERFKPVIQKYLAFFKSKERTQTFGVLEIEHYTEETIEIGLLNALCKNKSSNFDDVVRCVLESAEFEDNRYLAEFEKYGLLEAFWKYCESIFGYADEAPTLEKLAMTAFVTCIQKTIRTDVPESWKTFVSYKPGNMVAFLDNMKNSVIYGESFDILAGRMDKTLNAEKVFGDMETEDLADCTVLAVIDRYIIRWIIGRIESEDVEAKLNGKTIPEVCDYRRKMHFGKLYKNEYDALENAYSFISPGLYTPAGSVDGMVKNYMAKDYLIDRRYRSFYYAYDKIDDNTAFDSVRKLVESIYANDYLNRITVDWGRAFVEDAGHTRLDNQLGFYDKYIKGRKGRVAVIISDALRYEVGRELFERLQQDEKCECRLSAMQSVLPSVTGYGMAALLPHQYVTIDHDYKVLCDDKPCASLEQREAILKSFVPKSICVQYDDIKSSGTSVLKSLTTGQEVIYVYHNQIDARGDKLSTENEVFVACAEAVEELARLVRSLTTKGNVIHFIITADHGFLYRRDRLGECDKISGMDNCGKRYAITDAAVPADGVNSIPMDLYDEIPQEYRYVCSPIGSDVFKCPGSGINYVHGGCSPQEMIIPVIDVKTDKNHVETANVTIDLVSLTNKITNLNIKLDFLQNEPVGDTYKETKYRIFFTDDDGEPISNEVIYTADNREKEAAKRMFKVRFSFKNQAYQKTKKYYLIAVDDKNNMETLRREVIMDIAFAGDFGFGM